MNKLLAGHRCEKALKKISSGNQSGLVEIYETVGREMFLIAYAIVKDYQLAEDVVQDSLMKIGEHAAMHQEGKSARSWIMMIVNHTALDLLRKRSHEVMPGEGQDEKINQDMAGLSADSLILQDALMTLSKEDRQIVLLKSVAGFSHKEIADVLKISIDKSQKQYQRSLAKLREYLQ